MKSRGYVGLFESMLMDNTGLKREDIEASTSSLREHLTMMACEFYVHATAALR